MSEKMKILFIPYGTEKAPATRYRVTQYLPYLKSRGIEYREFSAISKFSTSLMIRSPDFALLTRLMYYLYVFIERIFRLFYILAISGKFDIVFLQRTTFPLRLERLLAAVNSNIIFDMDDAIYLPDKEDNDITTRIKKYIKKSEVVSILRVAKTVIIENDYLKDFVSRYCGKVFRIQGPIDTERFLIGKKPERDEVVIGWIGSPATTFYLHMLDNTFKEIKKKYDFVKFEFIGIGRYKNPDVEIKKLGWNYESEVRHLQNFDIGLMPMPDNEWTRGKLGCKMLQYMAVGIPAVVSYTPTNVEIIKNGENGFSITTEDQWIKVLSSLIENESMRKRIGKKARETIEQKCSLSRNVGRLVDIFDSVKYT